MRPEKHLYYLGIAKAVCKRSPCIRARYGAIVVKNDAIVSTGYNGPVRGGINCYEVGCIKDELGLPHGSSYEHCPAVHAEENAIINAARTGSSVLGGTLYLYGEDAKTGEVITSLPCDRCKRAIINAGISKVVIMRSDGSVEEIDVKQWVEKDTKEYLDKLELARKGCLRA
ncbi:cytidine deaminase [Candidatus Geothermarchaeota archaeon ex4572_27]|nr:MAG: cytidine deaminase [Candidatus Geothermarchaeota archaeon ex4572_27]